MKINNKITANITAFSILITIQAVLLFIPDEAVTRFIAFRPLFYLLALLIFMVLSGFDSRVVPNSLKSTLIAGCGLVLYGAAILTEGIIFGFGINAAASGFYVILNNLWLYGTIALVTEVLRFRIIKSVTLENRGETACALVFIYSFLQLDTLRDFFGEINYNDFTEYFFTAIFPVILLNAVLCYMAYEGSLWSLFIIRGVYSLFPVLSPFLPNMHKTVWAFLNCGILLVTLIFYHILMSDRSKLALRRNRIRAKLQSKSKSFYAVIGIVSVLIAAFVLRVFTYFPVVVLTGSMTGTLDRSSVVFVEKIEPEDVASVIIEGDIILFKQNKVEIMHRVIDIQYKTDGEPFYITKGDSNRAADPFPVEQNQVLGVTKAYIPYLGFPIVVIQSMFS
ncbi:MAG: signal peptidase I [Oscillospiraceae bacterium]|nr:signal peptidase I [Oscillospiraceae bacterium]